MNPKNLKHVDTTCPECKHTEILQDPIHHNIYCVHCGLVIEDNTHIFSIVQHLQNEEKKEKKLRHVLWRKRRK